jgi:ABC-2 type transport system permease protein
MFQILKKELNSFLNSLIAYMVIGVFLAIVGFFVWVSSDSNILDYGFADLSPSFFEITPYIFIFLIPAITMRSFSEEFKGGTIELLFTKPLTDWQIVLGKFLASFLLIFVALLPTLLYYYSVYKLGNPIGNIDSAAVFGSYIGLLLLGCVFAAIGVFSSSMTDNQVVAFILAASINFILYFAIDKFAGIFSGTTQYFLDYLSLNYHYQSLGKGLLDSRNILYLLSITFLALFFTKMQLSAKK